MGIQIGSTKRRETRDKISDRWGIEQGYQKLRVIYLNLHLPDKIISADG
jgi:hypothetical protein